MPQKQKRLILPKEAGIPYQLRIADLSGLTGDKQITAGVKQYTDLLCFHTTQTQSKSAHRMILFSNNADQCNAQLLMDFSANSFAVVGSSSS